MLLVAFLAAKFSLYCVICLLATRIMDLPVEDLRAFVLQWGAVRLVIGFVSAFFVAQGFSAWQSLGLSDWLSYVLSFAPARYVEWLIVLRLIGRRYRIRMRSRGQLWVLVGTLTNIVTDQLVLATGVDTLRFFC